MRLENPKLPKTQKQGFSLVELIIVIAIMAILIGVIAITVIPNIQRSRESKDFTILDNILSTVSTAIANARIETEDETVIKLSADEYVCPADGTTYGGPDGFKKHFDELLSGNISFSSKNAKGKDVYIVITGRRIEVMIGGDKKSSASMCEYTQSETSFNRAVFYISN